jgi:pyruvate dehydrogenase E2 component (dihydrolipoamide acetyltransferase)
LINNEQALINTEQGEHMLEEVKIPEISENVTSGRVVSVLVKLGDRIEVDDILIEFETEKALVEIPSTVKGEIVALPVQEGEDMQVGDVIAKIKTDGESQEKEDVPSEAMAQPAQTEFVEAETDLSQKQVQTVSAKTDRRDPIHEDSSQRTARLPSKERQTALQSDQAKTEEEGLPAPTAPSVRRFARELGVDIHQVKGSGPYGRITHEDVKTFVKEGRTIKQTGVSRQTIESKLPDFSRWGEVEITKLTAVRRLTANSVATSWQMVPHVTQFDQCDITHLEDFLSQKRAAFEKEGVKLTVTAVLTKVCALALLKFPRFNASIDMSQEQLIFKKYVHIGIAVATERGLLVPVVRHADQKPIGKLAVEIADLAKRARSKKLKPDEMEGGTFTISNQGSIGGTQFTPIVMWPQVAILGISRTAVKPIYNKGQWQPRSILPLALSYDHRIIDGADAASFLKWICDSLEQPLMLHL